MPKSLKQEIIYGIMMVFAMVYTMVCYNVTLNVGGMQNFVFAAALHELPIMCPLAFLFDFFVVGPIAKKITFRIFNPAEDKIIFVQAEVAMIPQNKITLPSDKVETFIKMIDALEENDDVQNVYHNVDLPDEE